MKTNCKKPALGVVIGLLLCGCADWKTPPTSTVTPSESDSALTREERIVLRRKMQEQKALQRMKQDEAAPLTGEVPDAILDKVMTDLEQRTGAARSEFAVKRAEAVQWADGSLGCGEPGQAYTQAIISGFWIVIDHQGEAYDYRASERGNFKLCADPRSAMERIRDEEQGPRIEGPIQ